MTAGSSSLVVAGSDEGVDAYLQGDYATALKEFRKGDYATALKKFRVLAKRGHAEAQYYLGFMYRDGHGVVLDYVQAHKWYNIAGANGEILGSENRNMIAKQMTSADISKAQKLAREWIQNHQK